MDIPSSANSSLQDSLRSSDRSAATSRELGRDSSSTSGARDVVQTPQVPGSSIAPADATAPSPGAEGRDQRYPSDPDRVTLSSAALQTERQERDESEQDGSIIDNDTGEIVRSRPQPPQENQSAIDAYGAIQNLS